MNWPKAIRNGRPPANRFEQHRQRVPGLAEAHGRLYGFVIGQLRSRVGLKPFVGDQGSAEDGAMASSRVRRATATASEAFLNAEEFLNAKAFLAQQLSGSSLRCAQVCPVDLCSEALVEGPPRGDHKPGDPAVHSHRELIEEPLPPSRTGPPAGSHSRNEPSIRPRFAKRRCFGIQIGDFHR